MAALNMFLFPICCVFLLMGIARGEEAEAKSGPSLKIPTSMEELDKIKPIKADYFVTIKILEDKRDALQQRVTVTGEIQAPYLGLMKAEGRTCRQLADQIKVGIEKEFFKEATVIVSSDFKTHEHSKRCELELGYSTVVALGNVSKTGKHLLPEDKDLTVSGLLELAGWHSSKSTVPKIRIIRKTPQGNKSILVNTKAILIEKRSEYDLFLRPDDFVIVE